MASEASTIISFAEARHAELQAESAQYRVARQASGNRSNIARRTAAQRRLAMLIMRAGTALQTPKRTHASSYQGANSV